VTKQFKSLNLVYMSNPTAMNGQSQQQATPGESIQAQQFQPGQCHQCHQDQMASQVYHGPAVNTRDANSGTAMKGVGRATSGESIQAQQFQPRLSGASQVYHGPAVNTRDANGGNPPHPATATEDAMTKCICDRVASPEARVQNSSMSR